MNLLQELFHRLTMPTPTFWRRISRFGKRLMIVTALLYFVPSSPEALGLPFVIPFQWVWWVVSGLKYAFISGLWCFVLPWLACETPAVFSRKK